MSKPADLIRFNMWANKKLIGQLKPMKKEILTKEFGGSFPSLRLTTLHLLQADWRWLQRWNGVPIAVVPEEWQETDVPGIISLWLPIQEKMINRVDELSGQEDLPIKLTTAKGDTFVLPFTDTVTHAVNHGTYHRGQLVNMLRMAGEKPVNTDYFLFCVEGKS
jgi:uncharacterized damage-inducible protein DinB